MKNIIKYFLQLFTISFAVVIATSDSIGQTTVTFNCTGSAQSWVVPPCVTSITVVAKGAQGGGASGGAGATVTSTLTVTPGQTLQINVGCIGGCPGTGFNGGGAGQNASGGGNSSCGGGGASDIRISPYSLASRLIVAAGGGGTGGGNTDALGGIGGCVAGTAGDAPFGQGGTGGTQTAGGSAGPPWISSGTAGAAGALGNGGAGGADPCYNLGPGAGGGGGYYGGGGGGSDCYGSGSLGGGGGGGGSSLTPAGGGCTAGNNSAAGVVTITYGIGGGAATASNTGPYCPGQTIQLNSGAGGTSYSWTGPAGYSNSTQNPSIPTAAVAMSGTYTVNITYVGCSATATTNVVVNPTPVTAVNSTSSCNGAAAILTGTGATSYVWSTSATTSSITVSPTTTTSYTVTGTSLGCSSSAVGTVTVILTPTPAPTNNGPVCAGTTLDLFCPAVTGATYSWTGPGGFTSSLQNPSITPVTAANGGNYYVTISIGACTSLQGLTNVIVKNTPSAPVAGSNSPICAGSNLILTASNIAGATYSWTGPAGFTSLVRNPPAFSATTAAAGTYSVTATVGGCTSLPGTVTVIVNPMPVAPTANNDSTCFGTSVTLTASVSGPTYEWFDTSAGTTLLGTGAAYTTPALTTSTTYYVHSTASGCTGPMTAVTVTVTPNFTVNAGMDDSICNGATSALDVISPTGAGFTYTWNPGSLSGAATTVSPSTTTTYTVSIIDAIGCSGSDSVTIFVGSPLVVNPTSIDASCYGLCNGQTNATASGSFPPYSYSWSSGTTDTTALSLCAGTYTVSVTDIIGCTASNTVTVNEPTVITMVMSSSTSHCGLPDGSVGVASSGGTGPHTYLWSPGGLTTSGSTTVIPGTYCVTITDSAGCTANACETVPSTPGVTGTITSFTAASCNGACDATANVSGSGGVLPYTYHWSSGQTTASVTGLCAGLYTCNIIDNSGCSDIVSVTIIEPSQVVIDPFAPVTICTGQTATLTANAIGGNGGPYVYNWTPAYTGNPYSVSPLTTTPYTVSATDILGCNSVLPQTVTVTVLSPITTTTAGTVSICPGSSANLSVNASGGLGTGYTYLWSPATGLNDPTILNPTATPTVTTTYTVIVNDGCSPSVTGTPVTVTVNPLPVPDFTIGISGCAPYSLTFTDITPGTISSLTWNFGDGGTGSGVNPSHLYENAGTYPVTVTATSAAGCTSTSTIQPATIFPVPEAAFTAPLVTSIFAPTVKYTDQSIVDPAGTITYWHWNFGDSLALADSVSSLQNPSHTFSEVGTYCAHLIVKSTPGGCADYTDLCIIIEPEFTFFIPNAFSPNDDGINEEFFGVGDNIKKYDMLIYDRWGGLLFHATDIKKAWNGKVNNTGEIVKEDVYVYVVKLTDHHDKVHKYIGSVTIVK